MHLRCAQCGALMKSGSPASNASPIPVACPGCGRRYQIAARGPGAPDDHEKYAQVRTLAKAKEIDLASACSVLEGIMTLEQARGFRQSAGRPPGRPRIARQSASSHRVMSLAIYGVGAMIVAAVGVHFFQVWRAGQSRSGAPADSSSPVTAAPAASAATPAAKAPASSSVPFTVPKTDASGQVLQVVGPEPKSVLRAFCESARLLGRLEAVEIVQASPPALTQRFGLFRNLDQPLAPARAIRIREDPRTGRWVAGDGQVPVPIENAPTASGGWPVRAAGN